MGLNLVDKILAFRREIHNHPVEGSEYPIKAENPIQKQKITYHGNFNFLRLVLPYTIYHPTEYSTGDALESHGGFIRKRASEIVLGVAKKHFEEERYVLRIPLDGVIVEVKPEFVQEELTALERDERVSLDSYVKEFSIKPEK